ncbi:tunicamycin resistance protein [Ciborinia camelliae]|nr:tunicamycin resistance protein [Ciborinia camelliae]
MKSHSHSHSHSPTPTRSTSPSSSLTRRESLAHLSLALACLAILLKTLSRENGEPLIASLAFSGIAYSATYSMIRWLGPTFMRAGLKGKDLSKRDRREIPETMGAICAVVYLLIIIVFIPFPFYKDIVAATSGGGNRDVVREVVEADIVQNGRFLHKFPHSKVRIYGTLRGISWLYF